MKKSELTKILSRFNNIRSISNECVVYWFAEDIKEIFNFDNIIEMKEKLDYFDMISVYITKNDTKKTLLVNEYGLYNLFITSSLPESKEFKNWLINDVIPSIRNDGEYSLTGGRDLSIQIKVKDNARNRLSFLISNFQNSLKMYEKNFNDFGEQISPDLEAKVENKWKLTSHSFEEMSDDLLKLINFFIHNQDAK